MDYNTKEFLRYKDALKRCAGIDLYYTCGSIKPVTELEEEIRLRWDDLTVEQQTELQTEAELFGEYLRGVE